MDFLDLKSRYRKDVDYPERTYDLQMYRRVLDGTLYDVLKYPFYQNFHDLGSQREPISLSERRPSVRYRLAKVVVDNVVSLLFGEGRFPVANVSDENTKDKLALIENGTNLRYKMMQAAVSGSVGSAAIFFRLINGKPFFDCLYTEYLTPTYNPQDPDELISVKQKYKISGNDLKLKGYENIVKDESYWFVREWTSEEEIFYMPYKVSETKPSIKVDKIRSIKHGLGFVPIVWMKTPDPLNEIDGMCLFKDAIDTNIELDYQMSQAGRGLKYSSEPLLLIKNPALSMQGEIVLGGGNVIEVDEGGDAKHVEISGNATEAVIAYANTLREIILENIHGNRSRPEKMTTVQSGRAMEMMNLPLVWLADKLRISFGEMGLKKVFKMLLKANQTQEFIICGERVPKGTLKYDENISLKWPHWFAATADDRFKEANTVKMLKDANIMSTETAVATIADEYDIIDIEHELDKIEADKQELMNQQPQIKEVINA